MSGKPKVAVLLSGCGVFDGAEIHESVLTLLALDRNGAEYQCFAPDIPQMHVLNHMTGKEMDETRNVLVEASRIARGQIKDLAEYRAADFDALILPGGFGAAKNLSSFAVDGPDCTVNPEVARALKETRAAGKPIGALCIAPVLLGKVLGDVELTIGDNADVAGALAAMGARHQETRPGGVVVDRANTVVTSPCYMYDPCPISVIAEGAEGAVKAVLDLARAKAAA